MKQWTAKGQSSVEFLFALKWILFTVILFITLVLYCARGHLSQYAGFMAARSASVWPKEHKRVVAYRTVGGLLNNEAHSVDVGEDNIVRVESITVPPVRALLPFWHFITAFETVAEPVYSCIEEDNFIPTKTPEACL